MQTVVSSEEMRWCDDTTMRSYGVPGFILMERAGISAAHIIMRQRSVEGIRIAVICGKGNNAGDGFVVARTLAQHGARVRVALTDPASSLRGDAKEHFAMLQTVARRGDGSINISSFAKLARERSYRPDVVVDGIFGTGFRGAARGSALKAIQWINAQRGMVVALDIPSGVDATLGTAAGESVHAQHTVTFGLLKTGLLLNEGRERSGHVTAVDIGIPRPVSRSPKLKTFLVEEADVSRLLTPRPLRIHKYTAGKVLVLAGARGYTGAATLSTLAALRSGAGAVVLASPDAVLSILARKLTEPVLLPLPSSAEGTVGADAIDRVRARFDWADAVVVGPGLGRTSGVESFLKSVLNEWRGPTVIDADALFFLPQIMKGRKRHPEWILTPHSGEFSAITGIPSQQADTDRIAVSRSFARSNGVTIVLKGSPTCVGCPDGRVMVNSTGNPGMATVGSGDVLSGLIGGLRAQGIPNVESAYAGVWIHGAAGDAARDEVGERSMLAGDILEKVPSIMRQLERRT